MKKLLLIVSLFLMSFGASAQNYNFNIGGLQYSSGASVPGSCPQEGGLFFKNAATTGWYQCSGGTYSALAGGGGGTPGGSSGQVQYNNGGAFAGDSGLAYNSTTKALGVIGTIISGQAGTQNGELDLNGTTSGTATITAPAVAGTVTNPFAFSNGIALPGGTKALPAVNFGFAAYGIYNSAQGATSVTANNTDVIGFPTAGPMAPSGKGYTWSSNADLSAGAADTGLWRSAAGVIAVGIGSSTTTGKLKASGYISAGTKFTTNNGCTDGANVGGATAGEFVVGSTSCTEVITMGDSATAANGWSCAAYDKTTLADVTNPHQTTSTTTTATIVTGTVVSGDHIAFSCIGY
jgi:hypothetical protein